MFSITDKHASACGIERTRSYTLYPHILVRPFFGFEVPQWTPNSQAVIVKLVATDLQRKHVMTQGENTGPATVFSFTPGSNQEKNPFPGWADGYICDLVQVDITTGEMQYLARSWRLMGWKVSPNGRFVAVLRYTDAGQARQEFSFDLMTLSLKDGTSHLVAGRVAQSYGICFNWSPDSQFIAYTTQETGDRAHLFVVSADGSTIPRELGDPSAEIVELVHADVMSPRWSGDGCHLYWLAKQGCWELATDGSTQRHLAIAANYEIVSWIQPPTTATLSLSSTDEVLYLVRNRRTKDAGIISVTMKSGESTVRAEFPLCSTCSSFEMEIRVDGSYAYLLLERSDHPAQLWQFHTGKYHCHRLFSPNAQLDDVALGTSRLLEYRTLDGEQRHAALLLPTGYKEGRSVPVIVVVYGGSVASDSFHCFGISDDILNGQLLAAHGYAVLFPDISLSDHDPMRQLPGQVIPAIHHLIERGIADSKRIGLMGQSYGGYCALALLVQTTCFAVAVANAGFYNLVSIYLTLRENGSDGWLGWCESGQGRMGGSLWEKCETYKEKLAHLLSG